MAYGMKEDPARSPDSHLDAVDYPVWRDQLVKAAADNDAPVEVINLFKCLPRGRYESKVEVERDFAEAARRFGMGNQQAPDGVARDRRNIGRDLVEGAGDGQTRHP